MDQYIESTLNLFQINSFNENNSASVVLNSTKDIAQRNQLQWIIGETSVFFSLQHLQNFYTRENLPQKATSFTINKKMTTIRYLTFDIDCLCKKAGNSVTTHISKEILNEFVEYLLKLFRSFDPRLRENDTLSNDFKFIVFGKDDNKCGYHIYTDLLTDDIFEMYIINLAKQNFSTGLIIDIVDFMPFPYSQCIENGQITSCYNKIVAKNFDDFTKFPIVNKANEKEQFWQCIEINERDAFASYEYKPLSFKVNKSSKLVFAEINKNFYTFKPLREMYDYDDPTIDVEYMLIELIFIKITYNMQPFIEQYENNFLPFFKSYFVNTNFADFTLQNDCLTFQHLNICLLKFFLNNQERYFQNLHIESFVYFAKNYIYSNFLKKKDILTNHVFNNYQNIINNHKYYYVSYEKIIIYTSLLDFKAEAQDSCIEKNILLKYIHHKNDKLKCEQQILKKLYVNDKLNKEFLLWILECAVELGFVIGNSADAKRFYYYDIFKGCFVKKSKDDVYTFLPNIILNLSSKHDTINSLFELAIGKYKNFYKTSTPSNLIPTAFGLFDSFTNLYSIRSPFIYLIANDCFCKVSLNYNPYVENVLYKNKLNYGNVKFFALLAKFSHLISVKKDNPLVRFILFNFRILPLLIDLEYNQANLDEEQFRKLVIYFKTIKFTTNQKKELINCLSDNPSYIYFMLLCSRKVNIIFLSRVTEFRKLLNDGSFMLTVKEKIHSFTYNENAKDFLETILSFPLPSFSNAETINANIDKIFEIVLFSALFKKSTEHFQEFKKLPVYFDADVQIITSMNKLHEMVLNFRKTSEEKYKYNRENLDLFFRNSLVKCYDMFLIEFNIEKQPYLFSIFEMYTKICNSCSYNSERIFELLSMFNCSVWVTTPEHKKLFLIEGPSNCGKSFFIKLLCSATDGRSKVVDKLGKNCDHFLTSRHDLICLAEVQQFDSDHIKAITGGDDIAQRALYQQNYDSSGKQAVLFGATNNIIEISKRSKFDIALVHRLHCVRLMGIHYDNMENLTNSLDLLRFNYFLKSCYSNDNNFLNTYSFLWLTRLFYVCSRNSDTNLPCLDDTFADVVSYAHRFLKLNSLIYRVINSKDIIYSQLKYKIENAFLEQCYEDQPSVKETYHSFKDFQFAMKNLFLLEHKPTDNCNYTFNFITRGMLLEFEKSLAVTETPDSSLTENEKNCYIDNLYKETFPRYNANVYFTSKNKHYWDGIHRIYKGIKFVNVNRCVYSSNVNFNREKVLL